MRKLLDEVIDRELLGKESVRDRVRIRDVVSEVATGWVDEIKRQNGTGHDAVREDRLPCRITGADAMAMRLVRLYFLEMGYRTSVICDGNRDTRFVEWPGVIPLTVAEGNDA